MTRPTEEAARAAVEAWLDAEAPGYPTYRLIEDGEDHWAFWIVDSDDTSYVHEDLSIEWYGTGWPHNYEYDGDFGTWKAVVEPLAEKPA